MPNIQLSPYNHASSFRKIAAAAWDDMYQSTIYGQLRIRVEPLEAYIAEVREQTGRRITITHCVTRALALLLAKHTDINSVVMNRALYLRQDVDIFLQVALPSDDPDRVGKTDLTGLCVRKADGLSLSELHDTIRDQASALRGGKDKDFDKTKKQANTIPGWVLHYGLKLIAWLQYRWNVDTTFLGAPRDPFGSAMVTSVGMFDARVGYAPFFPLARTAIILCIGAIVEEPVVEDGKVVPGRVINIQATMDHRVVDGYHAGILSKEITKMLTEPDKYLGPA